MADLPSIWDEWIRMSAAIVGTAGLSGVLGVFFGGRLRRAQALREEAEADHHAADARRARREETFAFEGAVNDRVKLIFAGYEAQILSLKTEIETLTDRVERLQQTIDQQSVQLSACRLCDGPPAKVMRAPSPPR